MIRFRKSKLISLIVVIAAAVWWFQFRDQSVKSASIWADTLQAEMRTGTKVPGAKLRINQQPIWHTAFPDGSWCLGMVNYPADRNSKNWALLVHSSNEVLFTTHAFYDYQKFSEQLSRLPSQSWTAFSNAARTEYEFHPLPR